MKSGVSTARTRRVDLGTGLDQYWDGVRVSVSDGYVQRWEAVFTDTVWIGPLMHSTSQINERTNKLTALEQS